MIKQITFKGKYPTKVLVNDPKERVQREWVVGHFMETSRNNTLSYVGNNLGKYAGGTIIDCGAHIGNHTLFFANVCKSQRVHAFEPCPVTFRHLTENVALNGLKSVATWNIALGDRKRKVGINYQAESIMNRIDYSGKDIQMMRLDDAVKGLSFPGGLRLIKIDVEGSEIITLKGAKKTLSEHEPDVIIECATKAIFREVDPFMKSLGYMTKKNGKKTGILILNKTNTYIYEHGKR